MMTPNRRWVSALRAGIPSDRGAQMARKAWPPLLPAARGASPPSLRAAPNFA